MGAVLSHLEALAGVVTLAVLEICHHLLLLVALACANCPSSQYLARSFVEDFGFRPYLSFTRSLLPTKRSFTGAISVTATCPPVISL